MKPVVRYILAIPLLLVLILILTNLWIILSSYGRVVKDIESLPPCDVAIVLGTSKRLVGGDDNPFFHNRIASAAELYHKGKVKHLLLSGDSTSRYYNEPIDMKKALLDLGVPEEHITLDNEGLRTYDSILRCKEVFGYSCATIVTQRFHSYRALFISRFFGLNAHAYITEPVPLQKSLWVEIREFFARGKAILDLYILY